MYEDDETLRDFIEESKEHLDGIESDFLAIEDSGDNLDLDLVNKVFRSIHSVKGGAGFLGLTNIKELSHAMENTLNMIRNNELTPTSEIVSILLDAADVLMGMINNSKTSNDIDISTQLMDLRNITNESLPDEAKQTIDQMVNINLIDGTPVFSISEFDLQEARKGGNYIYLVEHDLIKDIEKKGKNPLKVIKDFQQTGLLIDSKIDVESVGSIETDTDDLQIPFYVLFANNMDTEVITGLVDIDTSQIYQFTGEELLSPVSGNAKKTEEKTKEAKTKKSVKAQKDNKITQKRNETSRNVSTKKTPERKDSIKHDHTGAANKSKSLQNKLKSSIDKETSTITSLRVNINLLDTLMTLAGELVLTRNQLIQNINTGNIRSLENISKSMDMITSELQETIMSTRMQPIGNVFNKFKRVVRDMSMDLEKDIELIIEGEEVELDKTIIEAISDPLTHLVRNAVDHGIETPEERSMSGKKPQATITLRAFHEAGQVNIEIMDDGAGIDHLKIKEKALLKGIHDRAQLDAMTEKELVKLIFAPGFSTAEKVTDISGRGVGMDVVHTNLTKLGGIIDINTQVGQGTTILIKLPLTLAIIPSQIVSVEDERYAISQVNLVELVRVPAVQVKNRIEKIASSLVIRLREDLLPLIRLSDVLGITDRTYRETETGNICPDRRKNIHDRRSENKDENYDKFNPTEVERRSTEKDRRYHEQSAVNIAVVTAGDFHYGLIVDSLLDSEEIVVKPLGHHLKDAKCYAGATIQGDGRVALILDVLGISKMMNLSVMADIAKKKGSTVIGVVSFHNFDQILYNLEYKSKG